MGEGQAFDIKYSWGAFMVTMVLGWALWGANTVLTFIYYTSYNKDSTPLKSTVAALWLLNTVHEMLLIEGLYDILIVHFGDYTFAERATNSLIVQFAVGSVAVTIAQFFFTHRIWIFSGKKKRFIVILLPATLAMHASTLAIASQGFTHHTVKALSVTYVKGFSYTIFSLNAALDMMFSGMMVWLLKAQQVDGMRRSGQIIRQLCILSVSSSLWTSVIAVVAIITMAVFPDQPLWAAVNNLSTGLYCASVLTNLNVRAYVRGEDTNFMNPSGELVFAQRAIRQTFSTRDMESGTSTTGLTLSKSHAAPMMSFPPPTRRPSSEVRPTVRVSATF